MQNDWTEKIHCGDALAMLSQMPDKMVQCIVTSPPYYGLRDYGHEGQLGLEETPDAYVANLVAVFREARRVLKDDGVFWLNLGDSYAGSGKGAWDNKNGGQKEVYIPDSNSPQTKIQKVPNGCKPKDLIGIPWMVAFALRADGWYLRDEVIWHKPNGMPHPNKDRTVRVHEHFFMFSKSQRYFYDYRAIQEKANTFDARVRNRDIGKQNKTPGRSKMNGLNRNNYEMRNKRSVWSVNTEPYSKAHFATFPPNLIRPCILAGSREGDIVMDPFAGSGTTWQVCLQHERKFVGIELNSEYIDLAEERVRPYRNSLFKK